MLHRDVSRWVRRLVPVRDAEDLASEVVSRGLAKLGRQGLPWPQLRSWGRRAACRLAIDQWRRAQRSGLWMVVDMDAIATRGPELLAAPEAEAIVAALRSGATGLRREVLENLLRGLVSSSVLAVRLGKSVRAIEMARRWLREEALRRCRRSLG
jgi:DNA-directed RNA polymerase specialized sigma24 family protein